MKIERFRAENYRIFKEIDFVFPRTNCLIIVDDNEKGKSSLLLGILSCLYCHRKDPSINKDTRLELTFTLKGHKYTVVVHGEKKRVFEDEKDITRDIYKKVGRAYRYLVGESLFGLNEEEFINTAVVKQHELISSAISEHSGSLVPKIQSMVEVSTEGHNSAKAIELLRRGIKKNFPRTTLKNRAKGDARQELKALKKRLQDALNRKRQILEELSIEDSLVKQYEGLVRKIQETEHAIKLKELKKNIATIKEYENNRAVVEKLKKELSDLMPCPEIDINELLEIESAIKGDRRYIETERNALKKKSEEIVILEKSLSEINDNLKRYGEIKNRSIEQALTLQEFSTTLSEIDKELQQIHQSYHSKINTFTVPLEKFEKLHSVVERLSAQDLKLLEEYPEQQKKLKDLEQSLLSLGRLKKKRLVLLSSALSIVILSIILSSASKFFLLLLLLILPLIVYYQRISSDIKSAEEKRGQHYDSLDEIRKKIILNEEGIRRIKELYNIDSSEYMEYLRLVHDYKSIKDLEEKMMTLKEKRASLVADIKGIYPFNNEPSSEMLQQLIKDIKQCSELRQNLTFLQQRIEGLRNEINEMNTKIIETVNKLRKLVEKTLLVSVDGLSEEELFLASFDKVKKIKRAIELKDKLSRTVLIEREKVEELKTAIDKLSVELSIKNPPETNRPPSLYEEDIKKLNEFLRELYTKKNAFESRRREILTLKDQLSEIEHSIASLNLRIDFTEQYINAIDRAAGILQQLSLSGYNIWSERLNKDASDIFSFFTDSKRKIVFGKNLNFRIISENEELTDDEAQWYLSGGTLEQLYLAIRVTVSEYITPDIKLPLLLDEPFAHADDDRFLRAMRYITERLSSRRQFIILSCHRLRHLLIKDKLQGDFILIDGII